MAHSVRGCIRGLKIDGDSRPFSEATLASGVEKCYAKVEKGAYFNGEAWGLYGLLFRDRTLVKLS